MRSIGHWVPRLNSWPPSHRVLIVVILILSAAARVTAVVHRPAPLEGDSVLYDALARSLASGHGYVGPDGAPTAIVPPGYAGFVAFGYGVLGPNPYRVYLAQAVLGVLSVLLVMKLASLCLDTHLSMASGLMAALYPVLYWLPRRLLSENVALPLALGALCAAALTFRHRTYGWAALTGLLLGLGMLVRGAGLLLAATLLLGCVLFVCRDGLNARSICIFGVSGITCLLTILPWLARNAVFMGAPALSTQAGLTLYSSYWPPEKGGKRIWGNSADAEDPEVRRAFELANEVATSQRLEAVTRRRLREQPGFFFSLVPEKLLNLVVPFDWELIPARPGFSKSLNLGYLLFLPPAAYGAWRLFRSPTRFTWLLWVPPLTVLLQSIMFYGSPRFRLLAEPSLLIFAAAGLSRLWHRIQLQSG
jgi:4-amino-4-deoxy-L-arabinose transferase-like glycosyltransferase